MIRPEEIKRKAIRLYPQWQKAWLNQEPFFPRTIPCEKQLDENLAVARESILALRNGSKEKVGCGYSVDWKEKNSRRHGKNWFPERVFIESEEDLLRLVEKQREFRLFKSSVDAIRDRYPELATWIGTHRKDLVDVAESLDGLLEVLDYFVGYPRPNRFARELPLSVDTKFIEQNSRILRCWLDLVLPPEAIRADEEHFCRRFGLRYAEPLVHVRFLDEELQRETASLWPELAVPLHALAETPLPGNRVLIVENKVNLMTLPFIQEGVAMGGLGNSVTDMRYLTWLAKKEVWYWGDIDLEGFEILSRLRTFLPHIRSLMMNEEMVRTWGKSLAGVGNSGRREPSLNLTPEEMSAYQICYETNLRIEQERVPQNFVIEELDRVVFENLQSKKPFSTH
ncbi:Wadjet anti-phage system protein JetD domain-containing protein [Blastopirellula marina]|uniref:Wadjet protein JetD C-terminal domain-containing protein n=1 Tax=Blastopirellula marina DSM 3645 TaxID=314230 RepID=A3ZZA9_9BACT|nr:Wadjet anti-phage system protein JetD domain-containing protein [Blastopirellula marina]EAQ78160.1 hypothetical protein DSM3645_15325 [Blastopirellula marina DSM 3645]